MSRARGAAATDSQRLVANLQRRLSDTLQANAGLQREQDEALARERALAEVLHVINSSPGDLAPVFDTLLERALSLCEASFGAFFIHDEEFYRLGAHRGIPAALMDVFPSQLRSRDAGGSLAAIASGESLIHIADIKDTEDYRSGVWSRRLLADLGKARTALWIALRKDGALTGLFVLYRTEVRPFSEKQIALTQSNPVPFGSRPTEREGWRVSATGQPATGR